MAAETRTITFLFTDIEGSTRLLQKLGPDYADVLARHHELIRAAVLDAGGEEMGTEGDGFFAAMTSPGAAVDAAIAIQHAIRPLEIKVRIGIHSGDAAATAAGYVGLAVHQAARVCNAGHGGQVLLSQATHELAPEREVRDLGTWRLKDIPGDQRLYQLVAPGLDRDFPMLRTRGSTPHNLQLRLTSFIGREDDVHAVNRLLDTNRLVTLAGAGGSGKTRLAAEVAQQRLGRHADGVWWVDLAPLSGDDEVLGAVSNAVGAAAARARGLDGGADGSDPLSELVGFLGTRSSLVVLDNCEHVLDGAADIVESVLGACPGIVVLATSREALGVGGEAAWRIPSLELDSATELFVERARSVAPAVELDADDASVQSICERLDGMPLAIELAAAKVTVLGVDQIEARLDDRFRLLTGGSRRAMPRQQALRATIDWSYQLLSDAEQTLFRRLAVFVGGADLEAVEAVVTDDDLPAPAVVDLLASLVAKSMLLVDQNDGAPRYRFLETIRQYAREKLLECDDATWARDRHAAWARALGAELGPVLDGLDSQRALLAMSRDLDNLRAALDWFMGANLAEPALELVVTLGRYWFLRGNVAEALVITKAVLDLGGEAPERVRALALVRASQFASNTGDVKNGLAWAKEIQEVATRLGDSSLLADGLFYEAYADMASVSRETLERVVALADEANSNVRRVIARCYLALHDRMRGRTRDGIVAADDAVAVARAVGPQWALSYALGVAGRSRLAHGDYDAARAHLEDGLREARLASPNVFEVILPAALAEASLALGDFDGARVWIEEAGVRSANFVAPRQLILVVEARLAHLGGRPEDALRLLDGIGFTFASEASGTAKVLRGDIARAAKKRSDAEQLYLDATATLPPGGDAWRAAVEGVAACRIDTDHASAADLLVASEELRKRRGCAVHPVDAPAREALVTAVRSGVGDAAYDAAVAKLEGATDDDLIDVVSSTLHANT